jgi:23S rRNA pseudouridine2604 synthase
MENSNAIRLNKYISESGMCSRREADRFIEEGLVFINGSRAKVGRKVLPNDRVVVKGLAIEPKKKEEAIYIAFNKPPGIVCTTETGTRDNIIDYIRYGQRIFPIGRLDKDSQGLIFLTSNGDIVNKILRAGNSHEKEYLVTVNKPITDGFIEAISKGVPILGEMTKKCFVKQDSAFVFRIVLIQGLNRQIRRMCEHFHYEVVKLERVRIMTIGLKGIPLGDWRELTKNEVDIITELTDSSSGTNERPEKNKSSEKFSSKSFEKPTGKDGDRPKKSAFKKAGKGRSPEKGRSGNARNGKSKVYSKGASRKSSNGRSKRKGR